MKIAWITDTHLNLVSPLKRQLYYEQLMASHCDAIIHSGDIAEGDMTPKVLTEMAAACQCPIYFVCGNHDYFFAEIEQTKKIICRLDEAHEHLFWLPAHTFIKLNTSTALIGQDGWADTSIGDFFHSDYDAIDYHHIPELMALRDDKAALHTYLQQLACAEVTACQTQLQATYEAGFKTVLIVTHVPPFAEASWHNDTPNDATRLPFFTNGRLGEYLKSFAKAHPDMLFRVFSGHTHTGCFTKIAENMTIYVGQAKAKHPDIVEVLEFAAN